MTNSQAQALRPGDQLRCKDNYLTGHPSWEGFVRNRVYSVLKVEDCLGENMTTLQYDGHVMNWPLKNFELVLWFDVRYVA